MADTLSRRKRSWVMSRVKQANTKPEREVRSLIHRLGLRFRLHVRNLPGKPDIVLPKYRTVVFVNGCFWHHHPKCKRAALPSTHRWFWRKKIMKNAARDRATKKLLRRQGWRVLVIWTCQLTDPNVVKRQLAPLLHPKRYTHA